MVEDFSQEMTTLPEYWVSPAARWWWTCRRFGWAGAHE